MKQNKDFLKHTDKKFFSVKELAELLGISRIAVFKKIRLGKIKAEKVGRNYIIPIEEISSIFGLFVPAERRKEIEDVVTKTISEYGETLRLLGKE